jgi:hypothetical protein
VLVLHAIADSTIINYRRQQHFAARRTSNHHYRRHNSRCARQTAILFDPRVREARVRSDDHGPLTRNRLTRVCSETSSLSSLRTDGDSTTSPYQTLESIAARASLDQTARLPARCHPRQVLVRLLHRPSAHMASTRPRATRKTKAHDWRRENHRNDCMESIGISLARCTSRGQHF